MIIRWWSRWNIHLNAIMTRDESLRYCLRLHDVIRLFIPWFTPHIIAYLRRVVQHTNPSAMSENIKISHSPLYTLKCNRILKPDVEQFYKVNKISQSRCYACSRCSSRLYDVIHYDYYIEYLISVVK